MSLRCGGASRDSNSRDALHHSPLPRLPSLSRLGIFFSRRFDTSPPSFHNFCGTSTSLLYNRPGHQGKPLLAASREGGRRGRFLTSGVKLFSRLLGVFSGEKEASDNTHARGLAFSAALLSQLALSFLPPLYLLLHGIFSVPNRQREEEGEQARFA